MWNKVNPFTWEQIPTNDWEFYSKAEIDSLLSWLQTQINSKATATAISWTFLSANSPQKTITITNWVVTSIV